MRRVAERAQAAGVPPSLLPEAVAAFRRTVLSGCTPRVRALAQPPGVLSSAAASSKRLFPLFAAFASRRFEDQLAGAAPLLAAADLSGSLLRSFPAARAARRRLVYHHGTSAVAHCALSFSFSLALAQLLRHCFFASPGPTNSGKTHAALTALRAAPSGVYCGPLRLLATEVYAQLNGAGVYCNLRTGQERRDVPFAQHTACTVETADCGENAPVVDVAVLDEIQLLADDTRGWAWTRALYGLPARELHLCGDGSALPLVRAAAAQLGEPLVEREYARLTPLSACHRSLGGDTRAVQPGDALVAFSRRSIFELKRDVERTTGRRCAVVYGALPPEARTRQAALFNDPESGYDVLVASDAIGLGLNLNIRRVVFTALSRREGAGGPPTPLPASLVRQIAGRAGRAGSRWPAGEAAAFHDADVPRLLECLAAPTPPATAAGLLPQWEEHLAPFAAAFPHAGLPELLERVAGAARLSGRFFLCRQDDVRAAAALLERVPGLSMRQRFLFATAPVAARDTDAAAALLSYAASYAEGVPVRLGLSSSDSGEGAKGRGRNLLASIAARMAELEAQHATANLYLWLAQRVEADAFPDVAAAEALSASVVRQLNAGLQRSSDAAVRQHDTHARRARRRA